MTPRAPRRCARLDCDQLAPCPDHTPPPWQGSNRRAELPSDWTSTTRRVLADQPVCTLAYPGTWSTRRGLARCGVRSTEVDHIGDPQDHSRDNLRGVCSACHRRRTQQQANTR